MRVKIVEDFIWKERNIYAYKYILLYRRNHLELSHCFGKIVHYVVFVKRLNVLMLKLFQISLKRP